MNSSLTLNSFPLVHDMSDTSIVIVGIITLYVFYLIIISIEDNFR